MFQNDSTKARSKSKKQPVVSSSFPLSRNPIKLDGISPNDDFMNFDIEIEPFPESLVVDTQSPFDLVKKYTPLNSIENITEEVHSGFPVNAETAFEVLKAALKVGDDKFYNLVKLLLSDKHVYADREKEVEKIVFSSPQIRMLQRDKFILLTMRNIASDVLNYLQTPDVVFETTTDYYNGLLERLNVLKRDPKLESDFDTHVGQFITHAHEKSETHRYCFAMLESFFPTSIHAMNTQGHLFYLADGLDSLESTIKMLKTNSEEFGDAAENTHINMAQCSKPIADMRDEINKERRDRFGDLAATILKNDKWELEAGLPYQYRGKFSQRNLVGLGGLVPLDKVDSKTGTNVALFVLQYANKDTYKKLIKPIQRLANTHKCNKKGLCADNYEQMWFLESSSEREAAKKIIHEHDKHGYLLRNAEKSVYQYLQSWHSKHNRLNQSSQEATAFEKIAVFFIKLMNNPQYFDERRHEAHDCIDLIESANIKISNDFYQGLVTHLSTANRRFIDGSKLHKTMRDYRKAIESDDALLAFFNPHPDILRQIRTLERNMTLMQGEIRALSKQSRALESATPSPSEAKLEQFSNENAELRAKIETMEKEAIDREKATIEKIEQAALERAERMKQAALEREQRFREEMLALYAASQQRAETPQPNRPTFFNS